MPSALLAFFRNPNELLRFLDVHNPLEHRVLDHGEANKAKVPAWEAYQKAKVPVYEAYLKANALASKAYDKARAPWEQAYKKAKAEAKDD